MRRFFEAKHDTHIQVIPATDGEYLPSFSIGELKVSKGSYLVIDGLNFRLLGLNEERKKR